MQPTTANAFNLVDLYKEYFAKNPYHVSTAGQIQPLTEPIYSGIPQNPHPRGTIHISRFNQSFNKIGAYGQDIWHPVKIKTSIINANGTVDDLELEIDVCTTNVQLIKNIVRTPVVERKGAVVEICNIENPRFTIRGFLIDKNRQVPENEILILQRMFETTSPVFLQGGYIDLFLDQTDVTVISSLEFPEVQGRSHWIRPFTLQCEADFITDLIDIPS